MSNPITLDHSGTLLYLHSLCCWPLLFVVCPVL